MKKNKPESFTQQAARVSWITPLLAVGMMAVSSLFFSTTSPSVGPLILSAVLVTMFLAGMVLGVIGFIGLRRDNKKDPRTKEALIGIVLNVGIVALLFLTTAAILRQ